MTPRTKTRAAVIALWVFLALGAYLLPPLPYGAVLALCAAGLCVCYLSNRAVADAFEHGKSEGVQALRNESTYRDCDLDEWLAIATGKPLPPVEDDPFGIGQSHRDLLVIELKAVAEGRVLSRREVVIELLGVAWAEGNREWEAKLQTELNTLERQP